MKKRLPIIIGVVWLLFVTVCYGYFIWNGQPDGVYTYENAGCIVGQTVYVGDNEKETGFIYQMDLNGTVKNFFSTRMIEKTLAENMQADEETALKKMFHARVRELAYEEQLYAVLELIDAKNTSVQSGYVILELDENLQALRMTPQFFLHEADVLSDFSLDEHMMYLTAVSDTKDAASAYELERSFLDAEMGETLQLESFQRKECEKDRMYLDASYYENAISVRTDADLVSGVFVVDDTIRFTYAQCRMGIDQLIQYHASASVYFLLATTVGWVVLGLLWVLLYRRNRVMYAAAVLELLLLVVVFGGAAMTLARQLKLQHETTDRWFAYVLSDVMQDTRELLPAVSEEDFYDSGDYKELTQLLQDAKKTIGGANCQDVFLADRKTYEIYASASGRNRETILHRYFGAKTTDISDFIRSGKCTSYTVEQDGTRAVLLTAADDSDYVLCAFCEDSCISEVGWQKQLLYAGILFVLASMVCIVILAFQAADFSRLAKNMQLVAKGRTDVSIPVVCGGDMRMVWGALGEIQKKIRSVNYAKYRAFEAYYRFAPKNIEKLLNKASITEVESGNVAKLDGTMAMLATVGPKSGDAAEIARLNQLFALLGSCQEEKDGVFISNDGALSMLRFLFMEKNRDTVRSAIELIKRLEEADDEAGELTRTSILLHHASLVYGVAGTAQQSSAFLVSQEIDEIEHFAEWFRQHGLKLVISETVKARESYDGELRCIGYVQMAGSGQQLKLYEALDVYDARERAGKLELREKFEQALQLFYQHDFYLARSAFSDVLKELPTDEIAKWYLFTCEAYLNREHADDLPCALNCES